MCRTPLILLCAVIGSSALSAQKSWTVDLNGGADFRGLAQAFADSRVRDGDTLLIRPTPYYGYAGTRTNKALRLVGVPTATIVGTLTIAGAAGTVVLQNLWIEELAVQRSADVTITDCKIAIQLPFSFNGAAMLVDTSQVVIRNTTVTAVGGSPACLARGSTLWLVGCSMSGGRWLPSPALRAESGAVFVTGPGVYAAGTGTAPRSAIDATGAQLRIDPVVVLKPNGNAPPIKGGNVMKLVIPALQAHGAAPGKSVVAELLSSSGHAAVLLAGVHKGPLAIPPFGTLWLSPPSVIVVASTVQKSAGPWRVTIPVPSTLPVGLDVGLQAASGLTSVRLSNSALVLLR